jgi:8-oxo-dGTP pyrophosphatase MutT (NUDIX family)
MTSNSRPEYRLAVQVLLRRGNQILLLERQNTGFEDGNYGLPAGHIEFGETVKAAAIREAKEEVGVELKESDLQVIGSMHRIDNKTYVDFFLVCHRWDGEIYNSEPEKCSDLMWADLDALPTNMVRYIEIGLSLGTESAWFHQLES